MANHLDELYESQAAAKRSAGRYTIEEACTAIAETSGERRESLEVRLTQAARAQELPMHEPGLTQRLNYLDGRPVRIFYEEAYWSDLNDWLVKYEPRMTFRFPKPQLLKEFTDRTPEEPGWITKAIRIANKTAQQRYDRGERQLSARVVVQAVALELGKDSSTWGRQGPRSPTNVRTLALKGWTFRPAKPGSDGSNGSDGSKQNE